MVAQALSFFAQRSCEQYKKPKFPQWVRYREQRIKLLGSLFWIHHINSVKTYFKIFASLYLQLNGDSHSYLSNLIHLHILRRLYPLLQWHTKWHPLRRWYEVLLCAVVVQIVITCTIITSAHMATYVLMNMKRYYKTLNICSQVSHGWKKYTHAHYKLQTVSY